MCFDFAAQAGQTWMIEVRAAREGSPLDSVVRVLDCRRSTRSARSAAGRPRFVFHVSRQGFDSNRRLSLAQLGGDEAQSIPLRRRRSRQAVSLSSWTRLGLQRLSRTSAADSAYFDTTPVTHALQEPCYIVEPYAPGTELPANGLPVFTLYFENDDESQRRWGRGFAADVYCAPDGEYLVELQDVAAISGRGLPLSIEYPPAPA